MPRTVWLLVAARTVNRLGAFTLPFLTALLTSRLGASVEQAGLVLAAFGLATLPSRLLGGRLADRLGRRDTIVLGLSGCAVTQLLLAGSSTLTGASSAIVLLGLVFEIYESPSQAMIADVVEGADLSAAFGLMAAAMAGAGMAAGLLASALGLVDLRLLFVVDALSCLTCALVVRLTLPARSPEGPQPVAPATSRTSPWRDRELLALLAAGTVFAVVYLQIMITLPITLAQRGIEPGWLGVLLTVSAATVVIGQPLLGLSCLRHHESVLPLTLGCALLGAGLVTYGVVTTLPGFVVATVAWSVGDLLLLGRSHALVAAIAPEQSRGRYFAAFGLSWGLAAVLAPLVGTQLLARWGAPALWAACGGGCALLIVAFARIHPQVVARTRA